MMCYENVVDVSPAVWRIFSYVFQNTSQESLTDVRCYRNAKRQFIKFVIRATVIKRRHIATLDMQIDIKKCLPEVNFGVIKVFRPKLLTSDLKKRRKNQFGHFKKWGEMRVIYNRPSRKRVRYKKEVRYERARFRWAYNLGL